MIDDFTIPDDVPKTKKSPPHLEPNGCSKRSAMFVPDPARKKTAKKTPDPPSNPPKTSPNDDNKPLLTIEDLNTNNLKRYCKNLSDEAIKTIKKEQKKILNLISDMPSICGSYNGFQPSQLQQVAVWLYVKSQDLSLHRILVLLGRDPSNLFYWQRSPGWAAWFDRACDDLLAGRGLRGVHLNLLKLAESTPDSSAIKLYLQRFDRQFVERSSSDSRHSFAGFMPGQGDKGPSIEGSNRAFNRFVESEQSSLPAGVIEDNEGDQPDDSKGHQRAFNGPSVSGGSAND